MIFGTVALEEAEGAVLAHALKCAERRLSKGHRLSAPDIAVLRAAGVTSVIAARLHPDDLLEDTAAERVAAAIAVDHLRLSPASTGRVNLYAGVNGLFVADKDVVDRLNRVDPAITLACLADHVAVREGDMAPEAACEPRYRLAEARIAEPGHAELPIALVEYVVRAEKLHDRVLYLDRRMYLDAPAETEANPVLSQHGMLEAAFRL